MSMEKQKSVKSEVSPREVMYAVHSNDLRYLSGKILTIIDASIADQEQRKAMKDIATQAIWSWALELSGRVDPGKVEYPNYPGK